MNSLDNIRNKGDKVMNMKSLLAVLSLLAATALAGAAPAKPVKIYLLSGQSNMTGRGNLGDLKLKKPAADQKATLLRFIMEPQNVEKYKFLYKEDERKNRRWTVRDDVFITQGDWPHDGNKDHGKHGGFGPGYGGFRNGGFGPELGIGHALGDFHDEPVLLVKASFGANSLSTNFRPPSSGGTLGDKYPLIIKAVNDATAHLPEIIPGYQKETGYEIAGFFWNQGEHDCTPEFSAEYEQNLANLIKDLRQEFKAPGMKAVIAVTGFGGRDPKDAKTGVAPKGYENQLKVIAAQMAVPLRPEFKGTVATVETRDFYRPQAQFGGNGQTIHWHGNGESYWLMGEAMGREMVKLLGAKQERMTEINK
jgi:alpha-galactosidase